jgi:flagellar basal body rod protein FlgG
MNVSLYQAAATMNGQLRWQEAIAENLAATAVPGYKRQDISFATVEAGVTQAVAGRSMGMVEAKTATDFRQGELQFTGNPQHLALVGQGYFEVQLPNGGVGYTRDGEFRLDAQGQMVTKQGYVVQTDGGPVVMDMGNPAPLVVSADGEVSQGADVKGRIKVVGFNDEQRLTPVGAGVFLARDPGLVPQEVEDPGVRQHWLEGSNVVAAREMTHLLTAMRSFEANQRIIQLHDERLGRTIQELTAQ